MFKGVLLDNHDYPTDELLEYLLTYDVIDNGYVELLDILEKVFERYGSFSFDDETRTLRLATGGWSGCESVINTLHRNIIFDTLCWEKSERGGLHIFKLFSNEFIDIARAQDKV